MKRSALALVALMSTAVAAAAPSAQSKVTGYQTLIAIGNARGVKPALTLSSLQALRANSPVYGELSTKLRVSPQVFSRLMTYGNKPAPTLIVTQAVLQSAVGKNIFESAVAALIAQNPKLAAIDAGSLNGLLRSPEAMAAANAAADAAAKAVTPTSGRP